MAGSGKITTEYTVWCSKCERWYQTVEHRNKYWFGRFLRLQGWRFTRAWGWICSDHNEEFDRILRGEAKPVITPAAITET